MVRDDTGGRRKRLMGREVEHQLRACPHRQWKQNQSKGHVMADDSSMHVDIDDSQRD